MIDASTKAGAHLVERLADERIAWLTTVTPDGQPQTLPIWFVWEDGTILFYSKKVAARNRNLRLNPKVSFHLADVDGDDVVEIEGEAAIDPDAPPPKDHPVYLVKYAESIARYGWTPEYLSEEYPHPYRIVPSVVRAF